MPAISHQTVRLSKGKHGSPQDGACVMELASMLAGEPFTDHPFSVCPVIASFLRAYNDAIDDRRRQDLYPYASRAVGSRAGADVSRRRAERLHAWARELHQRRWTRLLSFERPGFAWRRGKPSARAIGTYAVHEIRRHSDETHAEALAVLDELLEVGAEGHAPAPAGIDPQVLTPIP